MKITGLQIDSYRHLQNLTFDFTYPEGHAKAGQPLEKICIIGQSATGKTGLLELVRDYVKSILIIQLDHARYLSREKLIHKENKIWFQEKGSGYFLGKGVFSKDGIVKTILTGYVTEPSYLVDSFLIYLSSDIINKSAVRIFSENPINIINDPEYIELLKVKSKTEVDWNLYVDFNEEAENRNIHEFSSNKKMIVWAKLLKNVLDYRQKFTQMASELINRGAIGDLKKLNREYEKWAKANINPLVSFSEHFNPLLKKLNLEVDLVNTEFPIPIKSLLKDEILPLEDLSTGTKSLLLSMFPLHELDTKDAVILIDEPERSLFPDIQIDLVDHYQRLAPDAQFIIATHSPFIAAAFEPEERFILYFDEQGNVAVRRGESPIGDDPNDMLRNDFKVSYYNQEGIKAYNKYRNLKQKLAAESDTEKKNELLSELTALGDKYNF